MQNVRIDRGRFARGSAGKVPQMGAESKREERAAGTVLAPANSAADGLEFSVADSMIDLRRGDATKSCLVATVNFTRDDLFAPIIPRHDIRPADSDTAQ
jgi:hypothetical protein